MVGDNPLIWISDGDTTANMKHNLFDYIHDARDS